MQYLDYPKEYAEQARESSRDTERAFSDLIDRCLGKNTRPARGAAVDLERALQKIQDEWDAAEHPAMRFHDRPEDLAVDETEKESA